MSTGTVWRDAEVRDGQDRRQEKNKSIFFIVDTGTATGGMGARIRFDEINPDHQIARRVLRPDHGACVTIDSMTFRSDGGAGGWRGRGGGRIVSHVIIRRTLVG